MLSEHRARVKSLDLKKLNNLEIPKANTDLAVRPIFRRHGLSSSTSQATAPEYHGTPDRPFGPPSAQYPSPFRDQPPPFAPFPSISSRSDAQHAFSTKQFSPIARQIRRNQAHSSLLGESGYSEIDDREAEGLKQIEREMRTESALEGASRNADYRLREIRERDRDRQEQHRERYWERREGKGIVGWRRGEAVGRNWAEGNEDGSRLDDEGRRTGNGRSGRRKGNRW